MSSKNSSEPSIIEAWIANEPRPKPEGLCDPMPEVHARFDDGRHVILFSYYPDEISFSAHEFIGLTEEQARALHQHKDYEYLKAP